jgi:hypothetical protein
MGATHRMWPRMKQTKKKGGKQKEEGEEGENITQYRHRNIYPPMVKKSKKLKW